MQVSIVIPIKEKECSRVAVCGIINNLKSIKDVHFIYPNYQNDAESMYKEWSLDRKTIEDGGKTVHFEASLEAENFDAGCPVVRIPPYCELKLGAFKAIEETALRASKNDMHFALVPKCNVSTTSIANVFLIVTFMLNWIHSLFYFSKLVQSTDILVSFVVKKGKHQFFPTEPNCGFALSSGIISRVPIDSMGMLHIPSGWEGLRWVLRNHLNFKFGLWMLGFIPLYLACTFPIIFILDLSFYALMNGTILIVLAFFTTRRVVIVPHYPLTCLLTPFGFILFPVVLMHAKG
jgi:hypothetical protein